MTLDGPSAVGKTTVSRHLEEVLRCRGHDPLITATPSNSAMGALARGGTRQFAGYALSCLVAADRYQHHESVIAPALAAGKTVICDRFMPSALVLDRLDGVPHDYVAGLYGALGRPHLAFVLVGDLAVCAARAAVRKASDSRFHSVALEQHERERQLFEEAITVLSAWRYPVRRFDIGALEPLAVATALADVAFSRQEEGR